VMCTVAMLCLSNEDSGFRSQYVNSALSVAVRFILISAKPMDSTTWFYVGNYIRNWISRVSARLEI
jgi:hypothetical protein